MPLTSNSNAKTARWADRAVSPADAVGLLRSGMRVFVHGASATPTPLIEAMVRRADLEDVRLYHLHLTGPTPFTEPEFSGRFHSISFFTGPAQRKPIEEARADFMPIFLSDIPGLFQTGRIRLDAALLQLSLPDAHGWCSLGTSVDTARAAADTAKFIIAEINEQMPRTHGAALVPFERVLPSSARIGRSRSMRPIRSRRRMAASASSSPTWSRMARRSNSASARFPMRCSTASAASGT